MKGLLAAVTLLLPLLSPNVREALYDIARKKIEQALGNYRRRGIGRRGAKPGQKSRDDASA